MVCHIPRVVPQPWDNPGLQDTATLWLIDSLSSKTIFYAIISAGSSEICPAPSLRVVAEMWLCGVSLFTLESSAGLFTPFLLMEHDSSLAIQRAFRLLLKLVEQDFELHRKLVVLAFQRLRDRRVRGAIFQDQLVL